MFFYFGRRSGDGPDMQDELQLSHPSGCNMAGIARKAACRLNIDIKDILNRTTWQWSVLLVYMFM